MKLTLQLVFLATFIVASLAVDKNVESAKDLMKSGKAVEDKAKELSEQIKRIIFDVIATRRTLDATYLSKNFDIDNHPQMLETEDLLNKNKSRKKIESCVALKEKSKSELLAKLRILYYNIAHEALKSNLKELNGLQTKVTSIFTDLKENLVVEVRQCSTGASNSSQCKFRVEYPTVLMETERKIKSIDLALKSVLEITESHSVRPSMKAKIAKDIYMPITNCILNLW